MKDQFTITISDVHGSRNFSFNQLVRKFALFFILFIVVLLAGGAGVIWWLNQETVKIEHRRIQAQDKYLSMLEKTSRTMLC
jgi:hypothetical protein